MQDCVTRAAPMKTTRKTPKTRAQLLQSTLESVKNQPNAAELLQAYENLRAMNSLQEIQRQVSAIPVPHISTHSAVC